MSLLFNAVSKMKERQEILLNSIGVLDEEANAMITGYFILSISIFWVLVGGFTEAFFFSLYNGRCHPFANILAESSNIHGKILHDKSVSYKSFLHVTLSLSMNFQISL